MNLIQTAVICLVLVASGSHETQAPKNGTPRQQSPSPSSAKVEPEQSQPPRTKDQPHEKQEHNGPQSVRIVGINRDEWDWISWGGGIVLVVVGCGGVLVANGTLRQIRRQSLELGRQRIAMQQTIGAMKVQNDILTESVAVAKQSAETTAKSFKAMIYKERARLSLEIVSYSLEPIAKINYRITCHGTTPAYILSNWESASIQPVHDFPWPTTAFGFALTDVPSVVPTGPIEGYVFIHEEGGQKTSAANLEAAIKRGEKHIHFRVRISYKDIFEDEHQLVLAKVYGVPPFANLHALARLIHGYLSPERYPEWRDSAYTYGDDKEHYSSYGTE
jgi:hypothetical protein